MIDTSKVRDSVMRWSALNVDNALALCDALDQAREELDEARASLESLTSLVWFDTVRVTWRVVHREDSETEIEFDRMRILGVCVIAFFEMIRDWETRTALEKAERELRIAKDANDERFLSEILALRDRAEKAESDVRSYESIVTDASKRAADAARELSEERRLHRLASERDEAVKQQRLAWERHAEKDRAYGEALKERDAAIVRAEKAERERDAARDLAAERGEQITRLVADNARLRTCLQDADAEIKAARDEVAQLREALSDAEVDVALERSWCRICRTEGRGAHRGRDVHPHDRRCILARLDAARTNNTKGE